MSERAGKERSAGGAKNREGMWEGAKMGRTVTIPNTCPYPGTMVVHYDRYRTSAIRNLIMGKKRVWGGITYF